VSIASRGRLDEFLHFIDEWHVARRPSHLLESLDRLAVEESLLHLVENPLARPVDPLFARQELADEFRGRNRRPDPVERSVKLRHARSREWRWNPPRLQALALGSVRLAYCTVQCGTELHAGVDERPNACVVITDELGDHA
jgi:hypothetical protein